jgi:uncharacterized protein YraI
VFCLPRGSRERTMARLVCGVFLMAVLGPAAVRAQAEPPPTEAPPVAAAAVSPEFWEVIGITAGDTLNLREGASTADPVVATLARGTVLRNLGCTGEGDGRWCEVETDDGGLHGWAAGRYLREHVEATAATPTPQPAVAGIPPTGTVFCSLSGGAVQSCPFVARQKDDGATELVVTFQDGFERILDFSEGDVSSPDPTDDVTSSRGDDTTIVEVNGVERIEVPDAAVPAD